MLDVRSARDPKRDLTGDTLGEEQWKWLEGELKKPGDITIIGLGIQALVFDRYNVSEKLHPKSYDRLMSLIGSLPGVILLSGDVHHTEIFHYTCASYPIHEFTSSGMTHSIEWHFGFAAQLYASLGLPHWFNIGRRHTVRNFGVLEFDWGKEVSVRMSMRDETGEILGEHIFLVKDENLADEYCNFKPGELANNFICGLVVELMIPCVMVVLLIVSFKNN